MKENYQKALKKWTLFFLLNSVPFNGQSYQKQKGPETSHQSLFRSQNEFRKIPLFVIYCLTNLIMQFKSILELFQKFYLEIYDINYSASICPFEYGKCWKEGKKLEYLENENSFLDEIKNIFHSYWRAIIWWKIKYW